MYNETKYVHPNGTHSEISVKFGSKLMSKTDLVPILTVGGCAFGVRILTKYFGARYFGVRPKKKPY